MTSDGDIVRSVEQNVSSRRLTPTEANALWHAGWQYREYFGHAFVDDNADKGCIHGCPGCYFDAVVRGIQSR